MDIKLKGIMDGIRTTEHIQTRYGVPIIYISGNSDTHMLERLNDTGPAGIIIKPINEAQLFKSVDSVLNNTRSNDS
jgi:CheY-like chemotaxis protein